VQTRDLSNPCPIEKVLQDFLGHSVTGISSAHETRWQVFIQRRKGPV